MYHAKMRDVDIHKESYVTITYPIACIGDNAATDNIVVWSLRRYMVLVVYKKYLINKCWFHC